VAEAASFPVAQNLVVPSVSLMMKSRAGSLATRHDRESFVALVLENRLFAATCAVSVVSCAALGRGKLWRPALVLWGLYSFDGSQLGELGGP